MPFPGFLSQSDNICQFHSWMKPFKSANYFVKDNVQCSCCNECTARQLLSILACVAGAIKGKGDGKIGRARNAQNHHHPRPLPSSRIASHARLRFPFSLPFSSACHAGYVNLVCDIISCFVNILSVASRPTHSFHTRTWWLVRLKIFWGTLWC